ncbi:hypothetical protein [Butyrivibrio sp. MC2013]|uniref:hypothetical protein n=1 Tax=Butyrivibrio sp. MC2013 TaxID=1280686 RepID=UPI0004051BCA|nr:hypothetical protein [Butyrivibrio sp. MC2013]
MDISDDREKLCAHLEECIEEIRRIALRLSTADAPNANKRDDIYMRLVAIERELEDNLVQMRRSSAALREISRIYDAAEKRIIENIDSGSRLVRPRAGIRAADIRETRDELGRFLFGDQE